MSAIGRASSNDPNPPSKQETLKRLDQAVAMVRHTICAQRPEDWSSEYSGVGTPAKIRLDMVIPVCRAYAASYRPDDLSHPRMGSTTRRGFEIARATPSCGPPPACAGWLRFGHCGCSPALTPADAVFPVVWTSLYAVIAWWEWRIWSAGPSRGRKAALRLRGFHNARPTLSVEGPLR